MINNFKLGMKMLRYGSGLVPMMIFGGIFLVVGLLVNICDKKLGGVGLSGDVLMMILAMFPAQTIYSLSASNLVQSSPAKKRMQTSIPATVTCFYMIALYLLLALSNGLLMIGHPELIGAVCVETVSIAGFVVLIMAVIGVGYKYFWVTIMEGVAVYLLLSVRMTIVDKLRFDIVDKSVGSFALALVIGLAVIVLGGFGQYGLSLLVYKAPMSKYSQSAVVRKEM